MSGSLPHANEFRFAGVKLGSVQGRFLQAKYDVSRRALLITEYNNDDSVTKIGIDGKRLKALTAMHSRTLSLPATLNLDNIIGQITCIACMGHLFICQYLTTQTQNEYVKFLLLDMNAEMVLPFEDTHHYFHQDSATVAPLECHLSPDKTVCLLRLPQVILSPKKWSKLLICEKANAVLPISSSNPVVGTKPSMFRDRRFQVIGFHPRYSSRLVTALLDSYCSKCKISVYDFRSKTEVLQASRKLPSVDATEMNFDTDSDSDNEELYYTFLQECSLMFSRSGETIALTCMVTDNRGQTLWIVYFLESITFRLMSHFALHSDSLPRKKFTAVVPMFTSCDSIFKLWMFDSDKEQIVELSSCSFPKHANLKSLCRSSIIRSLRDSSSYNCLPLPVSLKEYLQFSTTFID